MTFFFRCLNGIRRWIEDRDARGISYPEQVRGILKVDVRKELRIVSRVEGLRTRERQDPRGVRNEEGSNDAA